MYLPKGLESWGDLRNTFFILVAKMVIVINSQHWVIDILNPCKLVYINPTNRLIIQLTSYYHFRHQIYTWKQRAGQQKILHRWPLTRGPMDFSGPTVGFCGASKLYDDPPKKNGEKNPPPENVHVCALEKGTFWKGSRIVFQSHRFFQGLLLLVFGAKIQTSPPNQQSLPPNEAIKQNTPRNTTSISRSLERFWKTTKLWISWIPLFQRYF